LKIINLKIINASPKTPIRFISSIRIKIHSESTLDSEILKKLKNLTKTPIVVYENSGKRSEKKIFSVKYKKNSDNVFSLFIKVDSGLPIKRFVTGNDVTPNISQILDILCTCQEFDFLDIGI
jgi:tRNA pseudouridine synthase 10